MALNQVIECIPNVSEGRDKTIVRKISELLRSSEGIELLDVDSGWSVNRSVYTFTGSPEQVFQAVRKMYDYVSTNLNMRRQKGVHPRLGMLDVSPFVPIKNISVDELNQMVWKFGKEISYTYSVPVYFYEYSAWTPYRKKLETIRRGGYELLTEKYYAGKLTPDVGPMQFNFNTGATVMGVRNFLIAFNIGMNTTSLDDAKKIASKLRAIRNDENTWRKYLSGVLSEDELKYNARNFKVLGWKLEDLNKVQISLNLTDHRTTPVFVVYELAKKVTNQLGLKITESELIGYIPKSAIDSVANFLSLPDEDGHSKIKRVYTYLKLPWNGKPRVLDDSF